MSDVLTAVDADVAPLNISKIIEITEPFTEDESSYLPPWKIENDSLADWALRKIAAEKEELQRIKDIAQEQIDKINLKVEAAERRYENGTRFLTGKLGEYFATVPHKTTKTTESYRLLSGTLKLKKGGIQMEKDDDALVQYLWENGQDGMSKVTRKPNWAEYKKRLQVVDGAVIDTETGEAVSGVTAVEKPDEFKVEV